MPFFADQMDDYVRQLGMQEAAERPWSSRSLTRSEARAFDRGDMAWRLVVLAVGMLAFLWMGMERPDELWPWAIGAMAALAIFGGGFIWARHSRRSRYIDPCIALDVGEDGITFTGSGGPVRRAYAEVEVLEILSVATRSSRSFTGIVLASPFGPLRLEDGCFADGRKTAGTILKRLDELGLAAKGGD